jgi:hypothetical protein
LVTANCLRNGFVTTRVGEEKGGFISLCRVRPSR